MLRGSLTCQSVFGQPLRIDMNFANFRIGNLFLALATLIFFLIFWLMIAWIF